MSYTLCCCVTVCYNPLNPHDALKHHFKSLKNDLISWNLVVLGRKFSRNCFKNNSIFFHLPPTSSHLHPLQVENCDSNSRLVVGEDDDGKFRLERVKTRTSEGNQNNLLLVHTYTVSKDKTWLLLIVHIFSIHAHVHDYFFLILLTLKYFGINHRSQRVFFQSDITINVLAIY